MFRLGEMEELRIVKMEPHGAYLAEEGQEDERVLLPIKQVPEGARKGDVLRVFLYRDSEDRPIATIREPKLTLGKTARLKVAQVNRNGAFLEWGLEKDLFLPYRQQTRRVKEGDEVLAALYLDKSSRLAATMNVYPYLSLGSPYHVGDEVSGTIYEKSDNYGLFVAVDDRYSALIPKKEVYGPLNVGNVIRARVTKVKEDGRLDLSVREKAYLQMEPDMEMILNLLDAYNGVLPFTEKADPEVIRRETDMSKNEFKRAVGHLYKLHKITIEDGVIRKVKE